VKPSESRKSLAPRSWSFFQSPAPTAPFLQRQDFLFARIPSQKQLISGQPRLAHERCLLAADPEFGMASGKKGPSRAIADLAKPDLRERATGRKFWKILLEKLADFADSPIVAQR
jgi:hypothetical protein